MQPLPTRTPSASPLLLALSLWLCGPAGSAQEPAGGLIPAAEAEAGADAWKDNPWEDDAFGDLSLEDLLEVEVTLVSSGSRRAGSIRVQPVPVSLITADDVHYGGFTDLADALTFTPGIDVRRQGRTLPSVGVRGLTGRYSYRTLLLIDGRNANGSFLGSIQPQVQPVHTEDIERIEVVRGPSSAVWGPNALNGVINVITKDPRDTQGVLGSVQVNDLGDLHAQARLGVGGVHDPAAGDGRGTFARVTVGRDTLRETAEFTDSLDTLERPGLGPASFNDDLRRWSLDLDAEHDLFDATTLSAGVATSSSDRGSSNPVGLPGEFDEEVAVTRAFVAADQGFGGGGSLHVQAYLNHFDQESPRFFSYTTVESVLEADALFPAWAGHELSLGGQVRHVDSRAGATAAEATAFSRTDEDDLDAGFYASDRWTARPGLVVEGQGRFDHFEQDGPAFSGRLAVLQSLDPDDRHVLRVAAASAVRATTPARRNLNAGFGELPSPPFPPGQPLFLTAAGERNDEERTWGFELGYRGQLTRAVSLRADGYWQRYEGLAGFARLDDPFGLDRPLFELRNIDGAQGWGGETELAYEAADTTLSAWYAYHGFATDQPRQSVRANDPVRHAVGLRARHALTDALTLSANARYDSAAGSFEALQGGREEQDPSWRLDLTAAHGLFDGRGEVLVGVRDVLDRADPATFGAGGQRSPSPEGRSFFVRLQARF